MFLLFFIMRIVLKRKPFRGSFKKYAENFCNVAPRTTSSYHKVDWLSLYFDEITYLNRGVFPVRLPCHGRVVDAEQILVTSLKTKLCNIYYKVDIE